MEVFLVSNLVYIYAPCLLKCMELLHVQDELGNNPYMLFEALLQKLMCFNGEIRISLKS